MAGSKAQTGRYSRLVKNRAAGTMPTAQGDKKIKTSSGRKLFGGSKTIKAIRGTGTDRNDYETGIPEARVIRGRRK